MQKNMKNENKITLSEWDELTVKEKEQLRKWALQQGYELDLVPGSSGTFDPVCDYAALLTNEQMVMFLQQHNQKVNTKGQDNCKLLWKQIIQQLREG
jgi:hypothetical protein